MTRAFLFAVFFVLSFAALESDPALRRDIVLAAGVLALCAIASAIDEKESPHA